MPQRRAISSSRRAQGTWYDSSVMVVFVVALLAAQVDAGPVVDAGSPPSLCGSITAEGACFNDLAAFCSEDNTGGADAAADLLVEDCAGGSCALLDGLGAWCFADDGARCAFEAGTRATTHACGPPGPTPDPAWGCDVVDGCVALPVSGCSEGCLDAARLHLGCAAFSQPVLFSCAAFGGVCAGAACTALGAGAPCDGRLACAEGLSCVAGTCAAQQPGLAVDAGPPDPPAPPAPPPLCGSGSAAATVALSALLASSRRARRPRGAQPDSQP